ncbi:MAG: EpsI family protein [Bryobacterales bacterium]|nr:EpsI family protein [Bryobacterales bacterium]
MLRFLSSPPARILTVVLLLQAAAFYGMSRPEEAKPVNPLSTFPKQIAGWRMVQEGVIDKETMEVLRADDVVTRWYTDTDGKNIASLFIAYFHTQRTGKTPHSPKNCLPGAGWAPVVNDRILIPVKGQAEPVEANRFVVARGTDRSLVIYWYQTSRRTVASEYKAKVYTVFDSIRYHRSDTAIVKITIPLPQGASDEAATEVAKQFASAFFEKLTPFFPA